MNPETTPPKFPLESMDVAEEKRRQLKQLFPEVFTESRDAKTGELKNAVDLDKLRASLGEVLEREGERFGLSWPGKSALLKVIQQPSVGTLKPCREESVKFDETENLFIEGDNLEVLKLLQKSYFGKVKMIYIDPPYNTGNEFVYPDDFTETLETYLKYTGQTDADGRKFSTNPSTEGRFHSKWLNMMYPRLFLARNLLQEDGVVFISIDDNEVKNLRSLCDEIFGEENFVNVLVWKKRYNAAKEKQLATIHDYVLIYCKNREHLFEFFVPGTKEYFNSIYKEKDEFYAERGRFMTQALEAGNSMDARPNLRFPISAPDGSEIWPRRQWVWGEEKVKTAQANGFLKIYKNKLDEWKVRHKQYELDENGQPRSMKPFSIYDKCYTQDGTAEITELFESGDVFPFPKPSAFIKHMLNIAADEQSTVLDFFSGSGSTAQAVLDLNKSDGKNRKFIMVQLPELCDEKSDSFKAGFNTIADIGKERIRRVIQKIEQEQDGELDFDKSGKQQDLGFKVLKLSESNFKLWEGDETDPEKIKDQLEMHINHLDPKANPEDILYELLLKAGFPLTTKVEKISISDKSAYSIAEGALIICLDDDLSKEAIQAIAALKPVQCICLDAAFSENDQLKTNAVQTMEAAKVQFRTV